MRIALLSDCYAPRAGGIESQVADLARQLALRGHDVHVLTATLGDDGQRSGAIQRQGGVTIHRLGVRVPGGFPINPRVTHLARGLLSREHFDIAHAQLGVVSPVASALVDLALRNGVPVVATWHCLPDRAAPVLRARGRVDRWQRQGVALSAVSSVAALQVRSLLPRRASTATVNVLPNGIDPARWANQNRPESHPPARVHFVSASRFALRKRPWALVRIAQQVASQADTEATRVHLTIFGDGILHRPLAAWIRLTGAPVTLAGRVTREQLCAHYATASAYLAPTRLEAFGIAVLEARTCGVPIIARRESGSRDIITDPQSGTLVGSDAEMVAAAVRLVQQPQLQRAQAGFNRSHPPVQTWPHVMDLVEAEYRRAQGAFDAPGDPA